MSNYIKDGLLYCGECNTPKQCRITLLGTERTQQCLCDCEREKLEKERIEDQKKERLYKIKVLKKLGFPDAEMMEWTFEKDDCSNEKISKVARNYVSNFQSMLKTGKGLLFYGDVGTGKTYISACIANALIEEGHPCLVTNFPRLINKLSGMFEGKQEFIDSLNQFELIVIDDLASERDSDFVAGFVNEIIDSRYRSGKPIIITTNLTSEELKNPADVRKERIFSRLLEMCIPVEVTGKDRRKEKLKKDYKEMKNLLGLEK